MKEILEQAIENKKNDVNSYVWRFSRKSNRPDIKLMDATPEELKQFKDHCISMLYSSDKKNPGRYTLLNTIRNFRINCTAELHLRQMEDGSILEDGKAYPRSLYYQDLMDYVNIHPDIFAKDKLDQIPISSIVNNLPREYERLSIQQVTDACLDMSGTIDFRHITYNFIYGLGVYLTSEEMKALKEKDLDGKVKNKIDVLKERLFINRDAKIRLDSKGLTYNELRMILEMKSVSKFNICKYSSFKTQELELLKNKILFRLEQQIMTHVESWENILRQINKVAETRGISLD